ncbi:MAG: hypothetical protein AAGB00_11985 [Planctomycetota bacterium]
MARPFALLICLAASGVGLAPWLSAGVGTDGVEKDDVETSNKVSLLADPAESRTVRKSYLQRWIERATEFGRSTPAKESAGTQSASETATAPNEADGERGASAVESPDKPAPSGDEPAPSDAGPAVDPNPIQPPPTPASPNEVTEPDSPSDDGPMLIAPEEDQPFAEPAESAPQSDNAGPTDGMPAGPGDAALEPLPLPALRQEAGSDGEGGAENGAAEFPAERAEAPGASVAPAEEDVQRGGAPVGKPEAIAADELVAPEALALPDDDPPSDGPAADDSVAPRNEPSPPLLSRPELFESPRRRPIPPTPVFDPPKVTGSGASEPSPLASTPAAPQGATAPVESIAFPPLPPDPYAEGQPVLPPLEVELGYRGGSHLYTPEGDGFQALKHDHPHDPPKRLPECFQPPQPCTRLPPLPQTEYLGADPIQLSGRAWPPVLDAGRGGYQWEPRFVAHGSYDTFGIAFQEGGVRRDLVGHNLTLDADLRLTGTERLHVQHRPIGEDGTGGSFWRFDDPDGYTDNSTAEPARVWFEGELASIFSGWPLGGATAHPAVAWDINFALGKFPLQQHNNLLINDEVAGVIVGQNNLRLGNLSNLNTRVFWLWDDINSLDTFPGGTGGGAVNDGLTGNVVGADAFVDYRSAFIEATYAWRQHSRDSRADAHYAALSATKFFGAATATARVLAKIAGPAGRDGQLYVLEWNTHRTFKAGLLPRSGIRHAVLYANGFYASSGWDPIASANFNRLRTNFEVNPLVQIARGDRDDTPGVALGAQLFGEGEDRSLTPELAWEAPGGTSVFGAGLRYQRKMSESSFVELRGLVNFSDHSPFERDGVFASHHWLF